MTEFIEVHNEQELDAVYEKYRGKTIKKFVLKFYTDNCPPCKMLSKSIDGYVPRDNMIIININVNGAEDLKHIFNINSVPLCCIVDMTGNVLADKRGYMKLETFEKWIDEHYYCLDPTQPPVASQPEDLSVNEEDKSSTSVKNNDLAKEIKKEES